MSETDELRRKIEEQMRDTEKRLLSDVFMTTATDNALAQPAELTVDLLARMREQLRSAPPPIGNILLIGRLEDIAVIHRLIEDASGSWKPTIREGRYNGGPDKLVLVVIGEVGAFDGLRWINDIRQRKQPQIIKVYLESAEETFRKWKTAGEDLAQLIERLDRAADSGRGGGDGTR